MKNSNKSRDVETVLKTETEKYRGGREAGMQADRQRASKRGSKGGSKRGIIC